MRNTGTYVRGEPFRASLPRSLEMSRTHTENSPPLYPLDSARIVISYYHVVSRISRDKTCHLTNGTIKTAVAAVIDLKQTDTFVLARFRYGDTRSILTWLEKAVRITSDNKKLPVFSLSRCGQIDVWRQRAAVSHARVRNDFVHPCASNAGRMDDGGERGERYTTRCTTSCQNPRRITGETVSRRPSESISPYRIQACLLAKLLITALGWSGSPMRSRRAPTKLD